MCAPRLFRGLKIRGGRWQGKGGLVKTRRPGVRRTVARMRASTEPIKQRRIAHGPLVFVLARKGWQRRVQCNGAFAFQLFSSLSYFVILYSRAGGRMELACNERIANSAFPTYALRDPVIFMDLRVMDNLLNDERLYMPSRNYFLEVQTDIAPYMRKVVTTWMQEVCEEQMCEDQILPVAVNYMDRFLSVCNIKRQQLQLLGATCLLLASKVRSSTVLSIDLLCAYTDYSVTHDHISSWELLVLSKLQWNLSAITGFDYVDHIINRFEWGNESNLLRNHTHTLMSVCCTEPSMIQTLPSLIAAACICSAYRGLKLSSPLEMTRDICEMARVDPMDLEAVVDFIEEIVEKVTPPPPERQQTHGKYVSGDEFESPTYGQPETPTEVENVYF